MINFFLFFFISFIFYVALFIFFIAVIATQVWVASLFFIYFFKNFLKFFIPIYFILSFYSINYKGYYKLNFFGMDVKPITGFIYNIFFYFKKLLYSNYFLFISLFIIITLLSYSNEKIYFVIIILFSLLFVISFRLYNNLNTIKKYIERYSLRFNLSIIIGLLILLKNENADLGFHTYNHINFSDLIYDICYPRWQFRSAFDNLFPEYKSEIEHLKDGLYFNDSYLRDKYYLEHKNNGVGFRLDYAKLKQSLDYRLGLHKNFINKTGLHSFIYFKEVHLMESLPSLSNKEKLYQQYLYDSYLFNLHINKALNCVRLEDPINRYIPFNKKNLYIRSYFKELGLSINLLVNANLTDKFNEELSSITGSGHIIFNGLDKSIDTYLNSSLYEDDVELNNVSYIYNDLLSNYFKNKYSDYFLELKLNNLQFSGINNLLKVNSNEISNKFSLNIIKFITYINSDYVINKYDLYMSNDIYKLDIILDENTPIIDKYIRDYDIEFYIKFLNKFYRFFNIDSNIINWSNDLLINFFDNKKINYDYWNDIRTLKDMERSDSINLYRNFISNILYTFKRELNIHSYHEFQRDRTTYEDVILPPGVKKNVLNYPDVINLYQRYLNYDKYFEKFINSYMWLSLKESDIILEKYELLLNYNAYLNKYKSYIDSYIEESLKDPEFNILKLREYIDLKLKKLLKVELTSKEYLAEKEKILLIQRILSVDDFIKNTIFTNDILLKVLFNFKDKKPSFYQLPEGVDAGDGKPRSNNYIFFDRLKQKKISIKLYSMLISNDQLLGSYKIQIFLRSYLDYIIANKKLFNVTSNFSFIDFLYNTPGLKKNLYITEGKLLNIMLLNNLEYYKKSSILLNHFLEDTQSSITSICTDVYKASDALVERLEHMLKLFAAIVEREDYDKGEKYFLKQLDNISKEFTNVKGIFLNFNKILIDVNNFCEEFNANFDKFNKLADLKIDEVLFFNQENFIDHLTNYEIDLESFNESNNLLLEIIKDHENRLAKIVLLDELLERRFVVVDNYYFDNEMRNYDRIINENVNYYKMKKQFKRSTYVDSIALNIRINKLNDIIMSNNELVDNNKEYVIKRVNKLKSIEKQINKNFLMHLKKINEIIK